MLLLLLDYLVDSTLKDIISLVDIVLAFPLCIWITVVSVLIVSNYYEGRTLAVRINGDQSSNASAS
jgi:hypothetical protein